jgi:lipopolysaccharide transport system permease protein
MSSSSAVREVREIGPASFRLADIAADLKELYRSRELLFVLSLNRLRVRYKHSMLGVAWAFLQPLSLVLIYTLAFSRIGNIPSDGIPYPVFAFAGLVPWLLFATSVNTSVTGLTAYPHFVSKVYFPREILPLSYVTVAAADSAFAMVVLFALMAFYRIAATANILLIVPVLLVGLIFASAMALVLSAVQVHIRDVGLAVPMLLHVWLFATPVVYPLSQVPSRLLPVFRINPMTGVVENFRNVALRGEGIDWNLLGTSAGLSVACLVIGYLVFKKLSSNMADKI